MTNYEETLPIVLAVDDESLNLQTIRRVFRRAFDLTLANSGEDGLVALNQKQFDVALVDYSMPRINGVEFLKQARQLQPGMARVLVTAHADVPDVRDAQATGLSATVIMKPWRKETIEDWVSRFLQLRSMRHAVERSK